MLFMRINFQNNVTFNNKLKYNATKPAFTSNPIIKTFDTGLYPKPLIGNTTQILARFCNDINGFNDKIFGKTMELINKNYNKNTVINLVKSPKFKDLNEFNTEKIDKIIDFWKKNPQYSNLKLETVTALCAYENLDNKDVDNLSCEEAHNLRDFLIDENSALFNNNELEERITSPLLPKNSEEYCSILNKLSLKSVKEPEKISEEIKLNYYNAMNTLEYGSFKNADLKNNFSLNLSYTRENFINDFIEEIKPFCQNSRQKISNYFGLSFKTREDGTIQTDGYPRNNKEIIENLSIEEQKAIGNLRQKVEKFNNNKITLNNENKEIEAALNNIIKAFPEFLMTIGKKQHKTHSYTVDIHTLNVLQEVMKNPDYSILSDKDKKIMQMAVLLHDITKIERKVDKTHPAQSAYDAYNIISKMDLPEKDRIKIYELIKTHDWLEKCNKYGTSDEQKIEAKKSTAFDLRKGNIFEMSKILTKADLKSVKSNGEFYDKYKNELELASLEIDNYIKQIKSTSIYLPQTTIPKASELKLDGKIVSDETWDGITNRVVKIHCKQDLSKSGFAQGTKSSNFNFIAHAIDDEAESTNIDTEVLDIIKNIDSNSVISASYVNVGLKNYELFKNQGFIMNVPSEEIHAAYNDDLDSGFKKNTDTIKNEYLFQDNKVDGRSLVSTLYKASIKMTDEEYIKWFDKVKDIPSEKIVNSEYGDNVKTVQKAFFADGYNSYHGNYNEILISHPKITGLFIVDGYLCQLPKAARKYAQDNDLPVISLETMED